MVFENSGSCKRNVDKIPKMLIWACLVMAAFFLNSTSSSRILCIPLPDLEPIHGTQSPSARAQDTIFYWLLCTLNALAFHAILQGAVIGLAALHPLVG